LSSEVETVVDITALATEHKLILVLSQVTSLTVYKNKIGDEILVS